MQRQPYFTVMASIAFLTAFGTSARADAIAILQPTAEYTGATCLIPITGSGGLTFLEGCGETIFFSSLVASESPGPFGWGGPPDTEGGDPTVLRHLFFRDPLSFTLSTPVSVLGFEVGSNRILGDPIEVTFFDTLGDPHATIVRNVEAGHALLFAAETTDLLFAGASIRSGVGDTLSIARIRVGVPTVPEPSAWILGATAVLCRRLWRRVRVSKPNRD